MIIVRVGVEMRPVPDPLYGVTVDDVTKLTDIAQSLQNLSHFPTTRVVFDPGMTPTDYSAAITAMLPYSYIVGQPVDSSEFTQYTTQQYHDRFAQYLSSSLADQVDIWEVGNEVNGNWLGSYQSVNDKIYDGWKQVNTAGKRSMLTLWYNPNCAGSGEIDLITFSQQYVPNDMRNGLDYITISYYETQCNNYRPSAEALTSLFDQLHALYPNSKLVFGEVGLPSPVRKSTYNTAVSIINYYYALKITTPGYVGGYFWWNYVEDMVPYSIQPLWTVLDAALQTIQIPCAEAGC